MRLLSYWDRGIKLCVRHLHFVAAVRIDQVDAVKSVIRVHS